MKAAMVFTVLLDREETDVLLEIMRRGGFTSPEQLTRSALYHYAKHFDVDCPARLFARGPYRTQKPRRERKAS